MLRMVPFPNRGRMAALLRRESGGGGPRATRWRGQPLRLSAFPRLPWAEGAYQRRPARASVLDTALTPDGPRIVEVNCINSAGLYGADVERIVVAVEGMTGL